MPTTTRSKFAAIDEHVQNQPRRAPARAQCKLCRWLDDAPREDAEYVRDMIADTDKSASHVARVMCEDGEVMLTESSVKRHRQFHAGQ